MPRVCWRLFENRSFVERFTVIICARAILCLSFVFKQLPLALLYGLLSHFMKFTTLELLGMRYEAYIHFSPQILLAGVDLLSTNFQP